MSTAIDPNVAPVLVYAVVAVLVIASFVGAVLVVLGRVRTWLRTAFQEFTESAQFEATIGQILDRVGEKMLERVEARLREFEKRDDERKSSVQRSFQQTDDLGRRLDKRVDELSTHVNEMFRETVRKGAM
jgi:hypothetical protein